MNSLAEVGVLYTYIMIILLIIGLGIVGFKGAESLLTWIQKDKKLDSSPIKKIEEPKWIKVAFVSSVMLFLAVFSVGVLKTIGVEEDHSSHHQASGGNNMTAQSNQGMSSNGSALQANNGMNSNNIAAQQLQEQINNLTYQINQMENILNNR